MNKLHVLPFTIPDPGADRNYNVLRVPNKHAITIERAFVVPDRDVAADGSNYIQVTLMNGGAAGTGTDAISDTAGGASVAWTANVAKELTITEGSGKLAAGEWLVAKYEEAGTIDPGTLSLVIEYVEGIGSKA